MAARGVRIPLSPAVGEGVRPALRRRPRQTRAQASAQALQDAFVRVLRERGWEKTTIREVAAVAGVGVGTFYEYFGNMRALAAVCIHARVKALAEAGHAAIEAQRGQPLTQVVDALLGSQVAGTLQGGADGAAADWAALFLVERQVSGVQAFRKQYEAHVRMWQTALEAAADSPADAVNAARMLHALCYGWVSQNLLALGPQVDVLALQAQLRQAVQAYLDTLVRACAAAKRS